MQTRMRIFLGRRLAIVLGVAAGMVSLGSAPAPEVPRSGDDLAVVAKEVSEFLRRRNQDAVTIGPFVSPPQLNASAGPGITKVLSEELGKRKIAVRRRAESGLQGEFSLVDDRELGDPAARIKGQ